MGWSIFSGNFSFTNRFHGNEYTDNWNVKIVSFYFYTGDKKKNNDVCKPKPGLK